MDATQMVASQGRGCVHEQLHTKYPTSRCTGCMAARLGFRGLEDARARIQPTPRLLGLCERSQDRSQRASNGDSCSCSCGRSSGREQREAIVPSI